MTVFVFSSRANRRYLPTSFKASRGGSAAADAAWKSVEDIHILNVGLC